MKKILLIAIALIVTYSTKVYSQQVDYGSCQVVTSGSPCFFGLYMFWIKEVKFGTLNFTTGDCSGDGSDDGYQDKYSTASGSVTAGNSYTLTITKGGNWGDSYMMAWCDWNNDGDFSDPGEQLVSEAVFLANFFGSSTATIPNVLVPADAVAGEHRLRVRSDGSAPATNACATSGMYGDTKDFKLIVEGGSPCNLSASATATSSTCGNANGSIDLTVTGGTSPFTYSWSNGSTTNNISGILAGTYTVTVTDINGCTATAGVVVENISLLCGTPSGVNITNITDDFAQVNWDSQPCAFRFQIRYRPTGTATWSRTTSETGAVSKILSGLSEGTEYEVQVRTRCSADEPAVYTDWSTTQTFTTENACTAPEDVTVVNLRSNRATIIWNTVPGVFSYDVRYRKSGDTEWMRRNVSAPDTSRILTNVVANTAYEYQVRSNCGISGRPRSGWSDLQTFSTLQRMEDETLQGVAQLEIYPNPNNGNFTVEKTSTSLQTGVIEIYNMLGKKVFEDKVTLTEGNNIINIQLSHFSYGIYSLVFKSEEQTSVSTISIIK